MSALLDHYNCSHVSFDYGFISEEYRRLDQTFRYPKLCTVAGMRRHFPGQDCYKLGFLCERYGLILDVMIEQCTTQKALDICLVD